MKAVFQNLADQWRATTAHRWFATKSTTDQRILKVLGTLCVALLFYIGLWQPLVDFAGKQQQRAAQSQTLADWIAENRQALAQSSTRRAGNAGQPFSALRPSLRSPAARPDLA